MNSSDNALDDLKAIRQIMERTRRAAGGDSGWFMVLWGTIWFVGFLGNQFLPAEALGWFWLGMTVLGTAGSAWIGVRMGRRSGVRSPIWRPILLWMVAMAVFVFLIAWLFDLDTIHDLALLIVLTVALNYFQIGLFTHWTISLVGTMLAALAVGTAVLLPNYFFLVMAFSSGGLLVGSGLWSVRHEE
ncbi:MAG: hypothetical protein SWK90_07700 [Chloroflexota bacterium]|nr:hypothetical protein [Chloroflexota bacterium]